MHSVLNGSLCDLNFVEWLNNKGVLEKYGWLIVELFLVEGACILAFAFVRLM